LLGWSGNDLLALAEDLYADEDRQIGLEFLLFSQLGYSALLQEAIPAQQ
jgi:hypothetical protein